VCVCVGVGGVVLCRCVCVCVCVCDLLIFLQWRATGAPLDLTIFGEERSRFHNADLYPHYHDAEALVHAPSDPSMVSYIVPPLPVSTGILL